MKYRIISNGESYKVQKRVLFWWSTEGYEGRGMGDYDGPDWNDHIFDSLKEAEAYILKQCKDERTRKTLGKWQEVKVVTCK